MTPTEKERFIRTCEALIAIIDIGGKYVVPFKNASGAHTYHYVIGGVTVSRSILRKLTRMGWVKHEVFADVVQWTVRKDAPSKSEAKNYIRSCEEGDLVLEQERCRVVPVVVSSMDKNRRQTRGGER